MSGSAGGHQGKAVLRQHGGPSSHSKSSLGGNLVAKVPDEPLPDPTICEVKPGKETTIEVNKDKLGLGLSIVGGSDTLLVNQQIRIFPLRSASVICNVKKNLKTGSDPDPRSVS
jgi:hypothetical protein